LKQEEIVSCAAVISYDVEVIGDILFSPSLFSPSPSLSVLPLSLSFLCVLSLYVAGCVEAGENVTNTTYVFSRKSLKRSLLPTNNPLVTMKI
jgi:hypothetical protein